MKANETRQNQGIGRSKLKIATELHSYFLNNIVFDTLIIGVGASLFSCSSPSSPRLSRQGYHKNSYADAVYYIQKFRVTQVIYVDHT